MYKAVFIDIDGTLITSDHRITKATYDIVQKVKAKGILLVLVSARPLHGIWSIAKETGLHQNPIAGLNGAHIVNGENLIFDSIINAADIIKVHEELSKYEATPIYYHHNTWFSEFKNYFTDYEQKITSIPIIIQPFGDTLEYWRHNNIGPNKILVVGKEEVTKKIQDHLKQQHVYLNVYNSKPIYLEVMNAEASKVHAVKLLIDRYNIKQEETIAIGDNFNDTPMIEFAGMGIAMGNAPDEVKGVANYITDTNNNDGVAKALIKILNL